MTVELTLAQLAGIVLAAVTLAVTDGATISRLGVAWLAKKLGVTPTEIYEYDKTGDGEDPPPEDGDAE